MALVLVKSASPEEVLSALVTVLVVSVSTTLLVLVGSEAIEEPGLSCSIDELLVVLSESTDELKLETVASALDTVLLASLSTAELVIVLSIDELVIV